ncbi:hypothetical protein PU629_11855 [Pullulanibacillus sp. KACC 23026]|uniref:hypothetical protein n=1 Tax=Pullulanibacillus sp. KACC 23026 TaxID=3028315 RepID=UPI0023B08B5D|nr:hypothetical protein [Pullulanibacillus sp. KACC 23026]WEG10875.1 hypothetical protein PU629_11855 [Pullulanibacillus sp. KACC 23026]
MKILMKGDLVIPEKERMKQMCPANGKVKSLQKTQSYLQAALQSVTQAQAMENSQAVFQVEKNIQMASQTLSQSLTSAINEQEKSLIENAQQQLQQAEQTLQQAMSSTNQKQST